MKSALLRFGLMVLGISGAVVVCAQTRSRLEMVPEIRGYTYWTAVNRDPAPMNPRVAILCAAPPSSSMAKPVKGTQGPHAKKWINVLVNSQGAEAMLHQKRPHFPVGTVIIKQKLAEMPAKHGKIAVAGTKPELLTVMIKRELNYDRANGDWEYLVTDGAGEKVMQRGQLKRCQNCHNAWKDTDFVSRSYLPKAVFQALKEADDAMNKPK